MNTNIEGSTSQVDLFGRTSEIDRDDITIVIPVLNEEQAIADVIESVKIEGFHRIIIVDGFSTDNTVSIASNNGVKVIFQEGYGKTGAIETAINQVKTPYLVIMDGDCTYDPQDIQNFFPHLELYDQVIGTRTFGRENIPKFNRLGNWVINLAFNTLFGTTLLDVCSGMYALKTDFARTLTFETSGFDVEVEIAAQAATEGNIIEVPIKYNDRVGKQKLKPLKDGPTIMMTILKLGRTYNPVFFYSILAAFSFIPALVILAYVFWEWFRGIWHNALALLGVVLLVFAGQAMTVSTTSSLLRKMEQRLKKRLQK